MPVMSVVREKAPELSRGSFSRRCQPETESAGRVLVVDDEPVQLRCIRRILQGDWRVDTAVGAIAAASLLAAGRYDVVITDYNMPEYDGVWLLEQVQRLYPTTRRVLISGSGEELFSPHVRSGLIQRFLAKPAAADAVLDSLRGHATGREVDRV